MGRNRHNLVLWLTPGVPSRWYVLLEIATADRSKVQILPMELVKTGMSFEFPDDTFYESLLDGSLLGPAGMDLILASGFSIDKVVAPGHSVFQSDCGPILAAPWRHVPTRRAAEPPEALSVSTRRRPVRPVHPPAHTVTLGVANIGGGGQGSQGCR